MVMSPTEPQPLPRLLISLLPADGSAVGNGRLLERFTQAAAADGLPMAEGDFELLRQTLLAAGLVVKGRGRGGSTVRAAGAAPASQSFALDGGSGAAEPAASAPAATPAKARPRAADADQPAQVLSDRHADRRKNNPEVGLVNEASDPQQPKKEWAYNPHLDPVLNFDGARAELENLVDDALASGDEAAMRAALAEMKRRGAPYLQWAGKAERTSFEVDTVNLHVHERIDPMSILSAVRNQLEEAKAKKASKSDDASALGRLASLFEAPFESLPVRSAVDFYRHDKRWANRLIAGDSLQVKEGMAGQVQMIYIDPPYGNKFGSNFQPFVVRRQSQDRHVEPGHRLRRAQPVPAPGVLPHGRQGRRLAQAEEKHPRRAGRVAAGPVSRHRIAALRGRQAPQGGGEDRGRSGPRVAEDPALDSAPTGLKPCKSNPFASRISVRFRT